MQKTLGKWFEMRLVGMRLVGIVDRFPYKLTLLVQFSSVQNKNTRTISILITLSTEEMCSLCRDTAINSVAMAAQRKSEEKEKPVFTIFLS